MDEDGFTMVFSPALVDKLKGEDAEEEIPPPPAIIPPRENTYTTLRRQESSTFKEIQSMIDSFPVENTEKKKVPCAREEAKCTKCLDESGSASHCGTYIEQFSACMNQFRA